MNAVVFSQKTAYETPPMDLEIRTSLTRRYARARTCVKRMYMLFERKLDSQKRSLHCHLFRDSVLGTLL